MPSCCRTLGWARASRLSARTASAQGGRPSASANGAPAQPPKNATPGGARGARHLGQLAAQECREVQRRRRGRRTPRPAASTDAAPAEPGVQFDQFDPAVVQHQFRVQRRGPDLQGGDDVLQVGPHRVQPARGVAARHDMADLVVVGDTGVELVGQAEDPDLAVHSDRLGADLVARDHRLHDEAVAPGLRGGVGVVEVPQGVRVRGTAMCRTPWLPVKATGFTTTGRSTDASTAGRSRRDVSRQSTAVSPAARGSSGAGAELVRDGGFRLRRGARQSEGLADPRGGHGGQFGDGDDVVGPRSRRRRRGPRTRSAPPPGGRCSPRAAGWRRAPSVSATTGRPPSARTASTARVSSSWLQGSPTISIDALTEVPGS